MTAAEIEAALGYMTPTGAYSATPPDYSNVGNPSFQTLFNKGMPGNATSSPAYNIPGSPIPTTLTGQQQVDAMVAQGSAMPQHAVAGLTDANGVPLSNSISDKLIAFAKSSGIVVFGAILIIVAIAIPVRQNVN